jgi:hypothetical protein
MNRVAMSPAASALLRALIARAGVTRERVLLTDAQSIDWRSLTFSGERHLIELRVPGPGSRQIVERMCDELEEAEFSIPGTVVADIGVAGAPTRTLDGSICLTIEALTVAAD